MFLADIAHIANPFSSQTGAPLTPDADDVAGVDDHLTGTYDDELLAEHFMAGDGRVNENIGLTAVHHVFHAEHNRLVDHTKDVVLATASTGDVSFLNEWLLTPVPAVPADLSTLVWDGERLFQAARFGTEMQYQHLVFEEFARKIQPNIDPFFATTQVYDSDINPAIVAEFAHTVYRFGHSMLLDQIDRLSPDFASSQIGLIDAFLNPLAFDQNDTLTAEEAAGAIVRGTTRQIGNEIDEFKTEALRNNLLGLPLDLATVNLTRGREVGIPSLNAARRDFYEGTGDSRLAPYTSWVEFSHHLKHPESLVNFIAAYGTHSTITSEATLAGKRAAAMDIVFGGDGAPADRLDFLFSTGAYASLPNGVTTTGVDDIDFWIGGLAEEQMPFGGFLGSTFNFVFEEQLEKLQDGDRFYYLERTAGMNFLSELENNTFAKLIMANTDATHLPGDVFSTPGFFLEVDQTRQFNEGLGSDDPDGDVIRDNPATPGPDTNYLRYTGDQHVLLGGTAANDIIISSEGDDTLYGDGGNDRMDGGFGNDLLRGGAGDDILTDTGGDDILQGDDGNDVLHGGNGANILIGGIGNDFIINNEDIGEPFGGQGNDFILGNRANEEGLGNEGDDWIEFGTPDGFAADNADPFARDQINGNDVYIGDSISDRMDGEGGDDILVGNHGGGEGDRYLGKSGFDWAAFKDDPFGVTIDLNIRAFDETIVPRSNAAVNARFESIEGLSGSAFADILQGDDADTAAIAISGFTGSVLTNFALINGLQDFVGVGVTSFGSGNIILGGQGSDILEGRGGDDLIDGDRWLNVRISVRQNLDGTGPEIASFDSMEPLVPLMVSGAINPGQLVTTREILPGDPIATDNFDTVYFSGPLGDYTISIDANGTLGDPRDDIVTVTDNVGSDGIDRLTNIERLQFSDVAVVLVPGVNAEPAGLLTIDDATPAEGQTLTVSIAGVTDGDNVSATNTTGAITGPVSYFWQVEEDPGSGRFTTILIDNVGGELVRATGSTFTVPEALIGQALRVMAVYKDANDVLETVFSAATAPVANVNDAPTGSLAISDSTPTEGELLTVTNLITDVDGLTTAVFAYQWQQSLNGTTWVNIDGANGTTFVPGNFQANQMLRVVASYIDDQGTAETFFGSATGPVENIQGAPLALNLDNFFVSENLAVGGVIANVILDDDPGDTHVFDISDSRFTIVGGQLRLAAGARLDDADVGLLSFSVTVTDQLGNSGTFPIGLVVSNTPEAPNAIVVDANSVAENVAGAVICNLAVLDPDLGDVQAVALSDARFEVVGGVLRLRAGQSLNFETEPTVSVTVTSTDQTGLSKATPIIIAVSNVADTASIINGTAAANTLSGTAADDVINGLGGNDAMNGLAGNDTLDGGGGDDNMTGGAGNDLYIVDSAADT